MNRHLKAMNPDQNLALPVLIYGGKEGCKACVAFESEWTELCRRLQGQARLVKFNCDYEKPPPGPLKKYFGWYPSIALAGPKSYFRCFTPDDQVNEDEFSDDYMIRARKFNATEGPDGFEFAGNGNTARNVEDWFRQVAPTVQLYDEPAPPRRYSHLIN